LFVERKTHKRGTLRKKKEEKVSERKTYLNYAALDKNLMLDKISHQKKIKRRNIFF
jgi:hypothetical protein